MYAGGIKPGIEILKKIQDAGGIRLNVDSQAMELIGIPIWQRRIIPVNGISCALGILPEVCPIWHFQYLSNPLQNCHFWLIGAGREEHRKNSLIFTPIKKFSINQPRALTFR